MADTFVVGAGAGGASARTAAAATAADAQVSVRVNRRRALGEISVRLAALSHKLGDSRVRSDELCEDAAEVEAVARRIRRLAATDEGTAVTREEVRRGHHAADSR